MRENERMYSGRTSSMTKDKLAFQRILQLYRYHLWFTVIRPNAIYIYHTTILRLVVLLIGLNVNVKVKRTRFVSAE